ncbi:hypothetical protein CR513_30255, partial [Mucuna pruriens]
MAWEYTTIQQYETIDIKTLCRQTKVKWWKKFNNNLISKSKIDEWVNNNLKSTSQQNTSPLQKQKEEKEASFLLEKQKIMAELVSVTSVEEFEATRLKARSILDSDNAYHSDVESSEFNPYLRNGVIARQKKEGFFKTTTKRNKTKRARFPKQACEEQDSQGKL